MRLGHSWRPRVGPDGLASRLLWLALISGGAAALSVPAAVAPAAAGQVPAGQVTAGRAAPAAPTGSTSAARTATAAASWREFRFGPRRSGDNALEHTLNAGNVHLLRQKWSVAMPGPVNSSPAVVHGVVYVGAGRDVVALSASTGKRRWAFRTGGHVTSSPAVAHSVVYVGSRDGHLYALNATTGRKLWSFRAPAGVLSSPALADRVVYITAPNRFKNVGHVYALNATTGHQLWVSSHGAFSSSPAVSHGIVYAGSVGHVFALDASTGQDLWSFSLGAMERRSCLFEPSPAVANGFVYVAAEDGGLFAMNATTGHIEFIIPYGHGLNCSSPAVGNGMLYVDYRTVVALNTTSERQAWIFKPGVVASASPALANGVLYFATADGNLFALNASTGAQLWHSQIAAHFNHSSPSVVNGILYIGSGSKRMFAFALPRRKDAA